VERRTINSAMLVSIGYDNKTQILEAEFQSGHLYQYYDIAENIYQGLLNAESYGNYMNQHIIDTYEYEEVSFNGASGMRTQVESSMIAEVAYDESNEILELVYTSGAVWEYEGVEQEVYECLLKADSIGRYVRQNIMGCYNEFKKSN